MADVKADGVAGAVKVGLAKIQDLPVLTSNTQQSLKQVDKVADAVVGHGSGWVVDASVALAMVVVGWWVASKAATLIQRALVRARIEETFAGFLASMGRYIIFFTTVLTALSVLGVSGTNMLAVFGAVGLAVAFALRGTLTHVAAGMMVVSSRPFRVGDTIQIGKDGVIGTVKRITLFNTEINTYDGMRIFVPNSLIWDGLLINYTFNPKRMIDVRVPVAFDHDPLHVLHVLQQVVPQLPHVLADPAPLVGMDEIRDFGVVFLVRVGVYKSDYGDVRWSILGHIMTALQEQGIGLAYPRLYNFNGRPEVVQEPVGKKGKKHADKD